MGNVYIIEKLCFLVLQNSSNVQGVLFIINSSGHVNNLSIFLNTLDDVTNLGRQEQLPVSFIYP